MMCRRLARPGSRRLNGRGRHSVSRAFGCTWRNRRFRRCHGRINFGRRFSGSNRSFDFFRGRCGRSFNFFHERRDRSFIDRSRGGRLHRRGCLGHFRRWLLLDRRRRDDGWSLTGLRRDDARRLRSFCFGRSTGPGRRNRHGLAGRHCYGLAHRRNSRGWSGRPGWQRGGSCACARLAGVTMRLSGAFKDGLDDVAGLGDVRQVYLGLNLVRPVRRFMAIVVTGRSISALATKVRAYPFRFIRLDRAGVGLFLSYANNWKYIKNRLTLHFQFPGQIVDSNLLHPPLVSSEVPLSVHINLTVSVCFQIHASKFRFRVASLEPELSRFD
jgi:hypothetical protein